MGKFAWLLLAAAAILPAETIKSVSVAELDQILTAVRGKSDAKIVHRLSSLELTERVDPAALKKWEAEFPGTRAQAALIAITDQSAFLDLPKADLASGSPPDLNAQRAMLTRAVNYAGKALSSLPNFLATRETMHFEDTPAQETFQQSPGLQTFSQRGYRSPGYSGPTEQSTPAEPIHFVNRSSMVVTYRDGYEVRDTRNSKGGKPPEAAVGLTTSGEFGPILSVVLDDAMHGDVQWGYWEQGSAAPEAVFRYSVPLAQSHYTVALPSAREMVTLYPAYHGEIAIDPATGNVLRMTMIADLQSPYQLVQIAIMVDYAPVVIGERTYICPVRGVALSKIPITAASADGKHPASMETQLNDVAFTHYHLFRAETKILP